MRKRYTLNFLKALTIVVTIMFTAQLSKAQSVYLPNSYQLYQKFNSDIYSVKSSAHSSLRPFLINSTIIHTYDSVMNVGVKERKTWGGRKLFNEHLFDVKDKGYTFYADYITDVQLGRDLNNSHTTNLNTRGFQLGGTVGDKFSFYSSGFENSAKFVSYYNDYVNNNGFIPGQAYARHYNGQAQNSQDWSYVTAILSYSPTQKLNITLGEDKMFIGDGYRSVLLSDFAANMPLLRVTADLGPVRYMIAWAYLQDIKQVPRFDVFGSNRRKWALFHYIDWNITKRASLGFFNALMTPEADANGNKNGFDANFVNPLFFSSSLGRGGDLKDNILLGFNAKYKILDKTALYGQIVFDKVKNNDLGISAGNTNGWQVGIRGADIFRVKRLNYLFEFNTVKPYTYSSDKSLSNYGFYGDPLAHPLGANFREVLGILNYSVGRFDFQGQINYAKYGLDAPGFVDNNGKFITKRFTPTGNVTGIVGQGIATQLYYGEGTIAYILNPKYNLRFELGALYRQEKNDQKDSKNTLITFGLRSSFRNLYHDF